MLRFATRTIASVALSLVLGSQAGAMEIIVSGDYTFLGQSATFGIPVPNTHAYSDGKLYYSARADFDRTGDHGDTNFSDEGNVTFSLDGVFSPDVDFSLTPTMLATTTLVPDMNFGRDLLEGIYIVPKDMLNMILSDGIINFHFGFDHSIDIDPRASNPNFETGSSFAASLVFSSVPEPTSMALFVVGAIACGGGLARQRRRATK